MPANKLQDRRALLADHSLRRLQSRHRYANPPDLSRRMSWSGHQSNRSTACWLGFGPGTRKPAIIPFR